MELAKELRNAVAGTNRIKHGCLWLGLLTTIVVLALLLSGYRSSDASDSSEPQDKITIEFWTLQLLTFKDVIQPMIDAYERDHPNVRVRWVDVPFSEGKKRVLTAMLSGQVPDVVNLNPDFATILASRDALLNLQPLVSKSDWSDYFPFAWQTLTLDEKTFGVPWYVTTSVTLYNKQVLKQAGFNTPPDSPEKLFGMMSRFATQPGRYATMPVLTENGNFLKELLKAGIPIYDQQGNPVFASPQAIALLTRWSQAYQNRWLPEEALTQGHRAAVDRYQSGNLALLLTGANFLNIVKENAPNVFAQTDVAPQISAPGAYVDYSLMLLAVPTRSDHPKEALDFALYMTNAQNQLALCKAAPVLPSVKAALSDPYFQQGQRGDLLVKARQVSASQLQSLQTTYPLKPNQSAINETVDYYVQSALLGKLSPESALKKAQEQVQASSSR